jgi:hypothetical protein
VAPHELREGLTAAVTKLERRSDDLGRNLEDGDTGGGSVGEHLDKYLSTRTNYYRLRFVEQLLR